MSFTAYVEQGRYGYYDASGMWQRLKYCFADCGALCDCGPPMGIYYNVGYDTRQQRAVVHATGPVKLL